MQSVVQLVNRLQGAATLLGDNAGTADSSLPSLWSMLPSIVVIGGQVKKTDEEGRGHGLGVPSSLAPCSGRVCARTGVGRGCGGRRPPRCCCARAPAVFFFVAGACRCQGAGTTLPCLPTR